jgi:hypothetical protein
MLAIPGTFSLGISVIALNLQRSLQSPQPKHLFWSIMTRFSVGEYRTAPNWQSEMQALHA